MLHALTRQAPGGLIQQAIAAIENALVDVKARALGVPVAELLNGPVRERLRLYWSHCGSYRVSHADAMGKPPVRSLDDLRVLARTVREEGFSALKTNIFCFDRGAPYMHQPGFARNDGWPELNVDRRLLGIIGDQMAAFREGAGAAVDLLLDLNFNFKTEGYLEVARAVEPYDLMWLEIDSFDPQALALIRRGARTPIASCESLFGRRQFRPFLDARAMDVAIVDVPWNGILEHEDRGDVRGLRGQLRAAQLLRPSVDHDERALLRRDPQFPDHGDRHRRRALEGRGGEPAGHRGRASRPARRARLGRRGERSRDPSPPPKG